MATIRILLGIFCLAIFGSAVEPGGNILSFRVERFEARAKHKMTVGLSNPTAKFTEDFRFSQAEQILCIARSQIGVVEATGLNDGKQVETYLRYTGNQKGDPWCASFVSWVFGQAGYAQPKTAWSPSLFPIGRQVAQPAPARVFGIYFADLGRIAHCGLVEKQHNSWLTTIEGNTNAIGGREGDGVYRKLRHVKTIKSYASWLHRETKGGLQ